MIALVLFPAGRSYSAEQQSTAASDLVRRTDVPGTFRGKKAEVKGVAVADTYFENNGVVQGGRTGRWMESTNTFGYAYGKMFSYLTVSRFDRFDNKDYALLYGSYLNFGDSHIRWESGFGMDVDYLYRLTATAVYDHKLYKTLYWQVGYTYREYAAGDTHLVYPSLIYYFGDSYISAEWGTSWIEARDTAYYGNFRGNFAITDLLRLWGGVAVGERLYDIYGLDAREEMGYILFGGVSLTVYKDVVLKCGYSYSEEDPKFIKKGLSFGMSIRY